MDLQYLSTQIDKLLQDEYLELARNKIAYFRIQTGELDIFPKASPLTPEQKALQLKTHLKTIDRNLKRVEKTIRAIHDYQKSLSHPKTPPKARANKK